MAINGPKAERCGAKKEAYFAHGILDFLIFSKKNLLIVLNDVILNVVAPI